MGDGSRFRTRILVRRLAVRKRNLRSYCGRCCLCGSLDERPHSSDSPYSIGEGGAYVEDGNTDMMLYDFTYSTLDGATVDFFVDGTPYDLSQGPTYLQ